MNILVLGATGFIGTNLSLKIAESGNNLFLFGRNINKDYKKLFLNKSNVKFIEGDFSSSYDFDTLLKGINVVYHLISSSIPSSGYSLFENDESKATLMLIQNIVKNKNTKLIYFSSGGAIYGNGSCLPFSEETNANPISEYGVQKLLIEKYLYYYKFNYGLDYKIIRLSNPYGKYQKANRGQGLIATAIFNAIYDKEIIVFGDGNSIRDYIYIDDAVKAICNISTNTTKYEIYNIGSGIGVSINDILKLIGEGLGKKLNIKYVNPRKTDVLVNYLDINRYNSEFGDLISTDLKNGIKKTIDYWKKEINI